MSGGWDLIFRTLEESKKDSGVIFAVTVSNRMVELYFLARMIVKVRARQLTREQLKEIFWEGRFNKATFAPMPVRLESVEPEVIASFLPYYVRHVGCLINATGIERVRIVRLMGYLCSLGSTEGDHAFDVMLDELVGLKIGFSADREVIRSRLETIQDDVGAIPSGLQASEIPEYSRDLVKWVFGKSLAGDLVMEEIFLYYLFWGGVLKKVYPAIVQRSGSDEKTGVAHVAVPASMQVPQFRSVKIYRDRHFAAEYNAHAQLSKPENKALVLSGEARMASSLLDSEQNSVHKQHVEVYLSAKDISLARVQIGGQIQVVFSEVAL